MTELAVEEKVLQTDEGTQTCANPACNCAPEVASVYCCEMCEQAEFEQEPVVACACGHEDCMDLAQSLRAYQGEDAFPPR